MHIQSTCIPLLKDNIDTDQIIPAKFLSITDTKGLGRHTFSAWRYLQDGTPHPDFILNKKHIKGTILLTWENFGCGSSREHAVWALKDYGFQAIIAKSFSDIFYNNCLNNFVVPVKVDEKYRTHLVEIVKKEQTIPLSIDIQTQSITCKQKKHTFELNPFKKECLLSGQTNLEYLLSKKEVIEEWEKKNWK